MCLVAGYLLLVTGLLTSNLGLHLLNISSFRRMKHSLLKLIPLHAPIFTYNLNTQGVAPGYVLSGLQPVLSFISSNFLLPTSVFS
jgi:UPF0716 family protein affecting phage T7 exclusion